MHPILADFGAVSIYSYGMMVAIGFGAAVLLIYGRAQACGLDRDKVVDLAIVILAGGIVGARLFYVSLNIVYYAQYPLEIFKVHKGGLVWYGGFLTGFAAALWYARRNRLKFLDYLDLTAPYIALAQAFGRIGCFLNGCCFGMEVPAGFPLAVFFPHSPLVPRHPTQIYSSILLLTIFAVLRIAQDRRRFKGEIFLGYCMLYSVKRFAVEFLRGDNIRVLAGLTLSQLISGVIFVIASIAFMYKFILWKKDRSL